MSDRIRSLLDKAPWPDLVILAAFSFILGFAGGTPYFHPDSLLDNAFHTIHTGGIPDYYAKPGLIVYLNAAVYYLTYVLLHLLQVAGSFNDLWALKTTGYLATAPVAIPADLPGHLLTLAFSITGALVVYLWARAITGRRSYGLMAGALLSTSLLWLANSHYLTVDVGLGALCVAAMFVTARFTGAGAPLTKGKLCVLGLLIGLVGSAKYNGAIICVPISAALLPCYRKDLRGWVTALLVMAVVSILTFLATNPALVLDTQEYLDTLFYEHRHSSFGHLGYDTDGYAGSYFLFTALPLGFGVLPLLLSFAGAIGILWSKARSSEKIALLLFPLLFFVFMGSYKLTFDRFIVPLIPFLAILATLGIYYIGCYVGAKKPGALWPKALVIVLVAACLLPALYTSVTYITLLDRPDTREDLAIVLKDSGIDSPGLEVSSGPHARKPLQLSLSQAVLRISALDKVGTLMIGTEDIIVVDSFSCDRLIYDSSNARRSAYRPNENFTVVQINPFRASKESVPLSPGSLYSPYLPDMTYRDQAGPFIELYCLDSGVAEKITDACDRNGIDYEVVRGKEGYYYRMLYVGGTAPGAA